MKPDGRDIPVTVLDIFDEEGNSQESAPHARQILFVRLTRKSGCLEVLRRKGDRS